LTIGGCLAASMNDEMTTGTTTPLPVPPAGWFDYGYAVLWNGNLALLRTDRDIHTEFGRWRHRVQRGDHAQQPSLRDARLCLSQFDGAAEIRGPEVSAGHWPKVDYLADGRWLVASSRAALNEQTAASLAADGTLTGTFKMGDGIEHIRCAPDETIWVGYFDEGVFSSPNKDGSWPVSTSGIAHFGPDGSMLWRFNSKERADLFIADCYALTLDGNTPWCCPYGDFPIVRVEDGMVSHWQNKVAGAEALAVDSDYVLHAGGYKNESERIALIFRVAKDGSRRNINLNADAVWPGIGRDLALELLARNENTFHVTLHTRFNLGQLVPKTRWNAAVPRTPAQCRTKRGLAHAVAEIGRGRHDRGSTRGGTRRKRERAIG
jgi:hypothetical protein